MLDHTKPDFVQNLNKWLMYKIVFAGAK